MFGMSRRFVLGVGATAVAVALAGGAYVAGQNISPGQGPGPGGRGRLGGPGRFGPGGPGGPLGRGGPGGFGPMLGGVELNDDQRARAKEIVDSHREEQAALASRAMAAHDALEAAIGGDTFDESTVRTLAATAASIDADVAVARARVFAEVFQILTPDQQAAVKKTQANRKERAETMRANRAQRRGQRNL